MGRLAAFSTAMEVCDPDLGAHAARVGANAEAVALRLGWDEGQIEALRLGAALHDVGKVNVRAEVLTKPGRLDDCELAEIRAHPVEGMWLIAGVPSLQPALPYVLFHHERWDGLGYPTRRAATARIRPSRGIAVPALPPEVAAAEIERCTGTQFDPEIVDGFFAALDSGEVVSGRDAVAA